MRCVGIPILAVLVLPSMSAAGIITGTDAGTVAHVKVIDTTGATLQSILPYGEFTGGATVAGADVNGDGIADIITGAGPGAPGGHVKAFDGLSGSVLRSFLAYDGFLGGVFVAGGDLNRDGFGDIITGAGSGAPGGHVKAFDGRTGNLVRSFLAYEGFLGGARVAGADVNGDGIADIITGAGPGSPGGHVKVFDGLSGSLIRSFFSYEGFTGGVFVAGGDVNGDGFADIITGADSGAPGGHVKAFDGVNGTLIKSFFAYDGFLGGVRVAAADVNGDGIADIITGAGPGAPGGHVKAFDGLTNSPISNFLAYSPQFTGGVFVGGTHVAIPEPSSFLLLASSGLALVIGLLIRSRRRYGSLSAVS